MKKKSFFVFFLLLMGFLAYAGLPIPSSIIEESYFDEEKFVYVTKLKPGIHYLTEPLSSLGLTLKVPSIIEGDPNNKTILSGAIPISNWEVTPEGWWKAYLPEVATGKLHFEQLYVNGKRATRARTPDKGWFYLNNSKETIHVRGTGRVPEYTTAELQADPTHLASLKGLSKAELGNVMIMFYHKWDNTRKYLDYYDLEGGKMFLTGFGMKPWNPLQKGTRFVMENYKNALTQPGEWFLDKSRELFYIPRQGETPENSVAHAPILTRLLEINGDPNIPNAGLTFKNISFQHCGYRMPKTGDDPAQAAAPVSAAIEISNESGIHFIDCEVKHTGNYGIWFKGGSSHCKVTGTYLADLGAGGIKIGEPIELPKEQVVHDIHIENNIITQAGRVFPCGVGVAILHAYNNKVLHNEIFDLFYSGISVGWTWGYAESPAYNNEIAYNHIHHIGWAELSDMGAVYTLGISPGTRVHHNVIHDVYSYGYGGWGLYTDEGSTGIQMDRNLVYNCKSGGFHQHYGRENVIENNIFAFGGNWQLQHSRVEPHLSYSFTKNIVIGDTGHLLQGAWDRAKIDMDDNCYWDFRTSKPKFLKKSFPVWQWKKDKNSIVANPEFIDAKNGNFELKENSPVFALGFEPFDWQKAGVYGSEAWKAKAQLSPERKAEFDWRRENGKDSSLHY